MKSLTNKDWSAAITQGIAWLAGIIGIILAANTQFATEVEFGAYNLSTLNYPSLIFLGLVSSSLFGVVTQTLKAVDRRDTASQPPLIPQLAKKENTYD